MKLDRISAKIMDAILESKYSMVHHSGLTTPQEKLLTRECIHS